MKILSKAFALLLNVTFWSKVHSFATSVSQRSNGKRDPGYSLELTETEIDLISSKINVAIDLPLLNNAMEEKVIKAVLTSFCKVAPAALPEDQFRDLVSGRTIWDTVKEDVIHIINDEICIPVIPRRVQDQLVDSICTIMFHPKSEQRQMIGKSIQSTLSNYSEEELATILNKMIDLPLMDEDQEQEIFLKMAESIGKAFETFVPEPVRDILTHASPEELQEARQHLINRLNEKIDIPFKTEEEEREYFVVIVDFLLKRYGLSKNTKMPDEEWEDIVEALDRLAMELEMHESVAAKKKQVIKDKHDSLSARKAELEQLGHGNPDL